MSTPDAEKRAAELLLRVLNSREQAHFRRTGKILISGSEGGVYEIVRNGYVGNVVPHQRVKVGGLRPMLAQAGSGLCAHPHMTVAKLDGRGHETLPMTDAYISQILAIKANEKGFLRIANLYHYRAMLDW